MNDYLSQIAVRVGGAIMPHSLTPVQQSQGMFIPRPTDTGNDMTRPLPPPVAASPLNKESRDIRLPEPPLPVQRQLPEKAPEQGERVQNRVLYLERFVERPVSAVQINNSYTVTADKPVTAKPAAVNSTPARTGGNNGSVNDTVQPVISPQQEPDSVTPSQVFAIRPDAGEKEIVQRLQPSLPPKDAAVIVQQLTPAKAPQQSITVLTPHDNAKAPVPQARKPALPKVTIGRITVEVVPPPAVPVQTVPRNRQRSTGSPIPAPGSDEIHKLSFGFGQL